MRFFFIQSGCFLPLLVLFNFIFGWLVFPPLVWLSLEGILILLFLINSYILAKRISSFSSPSRRGGEVIDVEAQADEDSD